MSHHLPLNLQENTSILILKLKQKQKMRQDITPYRQLRQHRQRSAVRSMPSRPVTIVTVEHPVAEHPEIVEVDTYVFEPAPMTRPIEALSPEEKVEVLERALLRARQAMKAERRRGLRRILT
jgi:hypothetical protein